MRGRSLVAMAFALAGACAPVPIERGHAHPIVVRKTQRARAMEHARKGRR